MGQTWFFMTPDQIFGLLRELQPRHLFHTTIRRFDPPGGPGPAGFETVTLCSGLSTYYNDAGFSQIYLTRTLLPTHERDWTFTSVAGSELLTIEGGRMRGDVLEIAEMRLWTRPSKAQPLYSAIQRLLRKRCQKGMTASGSTYAHMFYHRGVAHMQMRSSFQPGDHQYFPLATASLPLSGDTRPN